jgi:hypothetical protein
LEKMTRKRVPIPELFLAVASVALGGVIGAWQGGITTTNSNWWVFFIVMPVLAASCFVAFWFLRREIVNLESNSAQILLEELPDPDHPNESEGLERALVGKWKMSSTTDRSGKNATADVTVTNRFGRLMISGVMKGQYESKIGEITSQLCDFDADARKVVAVYRVFGIDNGKIGVNECVLSGILQQEDGTQQPRIVGHWFQLYENLDRGSVTLTKVG